MKKMMKFILVLVSIIVISANSNIANALSITNPSISLDCTQFCLNAGTTLTFNRDNTGHSEEIIGVVITDGLGNIIYSEGGSAAIPSSVILGSSSCNAYQFSPKANPITLQFISNAGNGLPEQIAYQTIGTCQGLPIAAAIPTLNEWGMIIFMTFAGLCSIYCLRRQRKA